MNLVAEKRHFLSIAATPDLEKCHFHTHRDHGKISGFLNIQ